MEESAGTRDATIGALFTELDGPGLDRRVKSGTRDSSRRTFSAAAMAFAQSNSAPWPYSSRFVCARACSTSMFIISTCLAIARWTQLSETVAQDF